MCRARPATASSAGSSPIRLHFGGRGGPQFSILILWWLVLVAIATYILLRTRTGNWILASGGNAASARAVGVPTKWVKIGLFMFVGFSAWFYAMHQLSAYKSVQAGSGIGGEFLYIIAAVVGGCALTGGSGSAIGSAIGAFIYGMTVQGIVYAGWDPNWFRFFLGDHVARCRVVEPEGQADVRSDQAMTTPMSTPLIEMTGITKSYMHIRALIGVDLTVRAGEVTCVLGDNGAGKSTLIKVISGLHQPDSGVMKIDGEETQFGSPRDALDAGIATVYQDLAVVDLMETWRNFFLGSEIRKPVPVLKPLDIARDARHDLRTTGQARDPPRGCESAARNVVGGPTSMCRDRPPLCTSAHECSSSTSPLPRWA